MKKYLIYLLLIFLVACKSTPVDDDKLIELYVDLVVAKEKFIHSDSLYMLEKAKVLNSYNVNEEDYFNSLQSLEYDEKRWKSFFEHAKAYLDSLEKKDTMKIK